MEVFYPGYPVNAAKKETYVCDYSELLSSQNISIVAAVGNRGEMGKQGRIPWHLPKDLHRFKALTIGHPIIMGRKTWESLPTKPLPERRNMVLTRQEHWAAVGAELFASPAEALAALPFHAEPFVIGGAAVFQEFLPLAKTIYLTRVLHDFEADTFFPAVKWEEWNLVEDEWVSKDEKNGYDCKFQKWEKKY